MTHTPPVPIGNQSPYPLHPTPMVHDAPRRVATTPQTLPVVGIVAVATVGITAIVAGILYALRDRPPPKRKGKAKKAKPRQA